MLLVPFFTAFSAYYGFTFITPRESMDSFRHREDFVRLSNKVDYNFMEFIGSLYSTETDSADILLPFLKFIVGKFTSNPDIFYAVLGGLFGYVMALNIKILVRSLRFTKINKYLFFVLVLFTFTIGIWEINSFRFWFGAHLFFLGFSPYLIYNDKSKLWLILLTPFIHFGWFLCLPLLLAYFLLKKRYMIIYFLFVGSYFASEIANNDVLKALIPGTNIEVFEERKDAYIREQDEDKVTAKENNNWYVAFRNKPIKWLNLLFVSCIIIFHKKEIQESKYFKTLIFSMLFIAISHALMITIPQFGRFYRAGLLFLYLTLIGMYDIYRYSDWFKKIRILYILCAGFFLVVETRILFDTFTIDSIFSNPLIALWIKTEIPLIDLIK